MIVYVAVTAADFLVLEPLSTPDTYRAGEPSPGSGDLVLHATPGDLREIAHHLAELADAVERRRNVAEIRSSLL